MMTSRYSILQICSVEFTFTHFIHRLCSSLVSRNWNVTASLKSDINSNFHLTLPSDGINLPSTFYRSVRFSDLRRTWSSLIRLFSSDDSRLVHVHTPLLSYLVSSILFPFCGAAVN